MRLPCSTIIQMCCGLIPLTPPFQVPEPMLPPPLTANYFISCIKQCLASTILTPFLSPHFHTERLATLPFTTQQAWGDGRPVEPQYPQLTGHYTVATLVIDNSSTLYITSRSKDSSLPATFILFITHNFYPLGHTCSPLLVDSCSWNSASRSVLVPLLEGQLVHFSIHPGSEEGTNAIPMHRWPEPAALHGGTACPLSIPRSDGECVKVVSAWCHCSQVQFGNKANVQ